ncbi:phosphate ABC transporter substrate-binding protein PstS [Streptomyces acidiscabies]|uniref:Phosphate-binding protein n=1 Tax=Streptomyces acidiscabies TaxID=42234 RepID=A0AAP6EK14_9ACTN|nr:phosphate ABC transporter substrate-binding protein PstS [Streptomyces acidiscabies]MBP5938674.1 phosphate ABC transporter substrate-binding protein PstS [Streptomyces sp. LBUM 1476]MBZ3909779.1 phosphate ABC transporter substrate-binding protein PstS [Streptomyces acidiscabies]MDX2965807.1 phosphate ABC transporter substrate-binding protein PstS [Streptomyces acidiscabies]MDX3025231.1 phosphate ABC transporter substrate-binding protein PstS [Streptomyces acidiscabies]MDX3795643.1 phosphate
MKLQRKNRRALALGALAVSGALALTACGSDDTGSKGSDTSSSAASNNAGSVKCDGAKGQLLADGSSAQKNAIGAWVKNFTQACPGVQINYKGQGSGAGITAFNQGTVAFAGSDSPLKPEEITASKSVCSGGQGIDLPMVAGPIAVAYNLSGVSDLVLDAPTIAKIFKGEITKWNDPAIVKLNAGAKLPDVKIQPYHRSDESGTTDNFTKYLKAAAPSDWTFSGGKAWQAKGGQSASGSSGVAGGVKQTNGAIGYMELSYAKDGLNAVAINTGAAAPVKASSDGATKAVAAAQVVGTGSDLSLKLDYTTKAEGAYPITLVTYEIACDKGNKAATLPATKAFLRYVASTDGQSLLSGIDYAPIPDAIITKVRSTIEGLS